MAGKGPAPNESGRSRDRDNKALEELVYNGEIWGDPLPDGVLGVHESGPLEGQDIQWHAQTLVWWDAIRTWPIMKDEMAASWQFMVTTAMLHHKMWTNGRWDFAAEVRLREAKYGITPDDLRRLGKKIKRAGDPDLQVVEPGTVTSISPAQERKQRLLDQQQAARDAAEDEGEGSTS
jgi:hypothetical protein